MRGLDNWITGNWGEDHPDNQLCRDCGKDGDHHCSKCGGCGAPGFFDDASNICDDCARTCDYCGAEEVENIIIHNWTHGEKSGTDRICPDCFGEV